MLSCPNKRLKVWKDLVKAVGENKAYVLWANYSGNVPQEYYEVTKEPFEDKKEDKSIADFFNEGAEEMFLLNKVSRKEVSQKSEIEKILFNTHDVQEKYTAKEILENIINNFKDTRPVALKFLERAKMLMDKTNAKVEVVPAYELGSTAFMDYDASINVIRVSLDKLNDSIPIAGVKSFLHEVVHSVTMNVAKNPKTIEQEQLRNFIYEAFSYYKENTRNPDLYGFTDIEEFMAEAMTNPSFQADMKTTDDRLIVKEGKNLWENFIALIRRVFGLRRIDGYKLINSITDLSEDIWEESFTNRKSDVREDVNQDTESIYKDLSTPESKLEDAIERILENISDNLDYYSYRKKTTKDEKKQKGFQYYIDKLTTLQTNIQLYKSTNQALAIITFTSNMKDSLAYIESVIDNVAKDDIEGLLNIVKNYNNYLMTFSLINDVQDIINEISYDEGQKIFTKSEIKDLSDTLKNSVGTFEKLSSKIRTLKRMGMQEYLTNLHFFPDVEYEFRQKLTAEARQLNIPKKDTEQFITERMLGRDAAAIQTALEERVAQLLNNPLFDIYEADKMYSSAINVSAPLIQLMNQMLMDLDNERVGIERAKDVEFKNIFNKLVEEKGTTDIKKLYSNLIERSKDGKWYLKGDYSIEVMNAITEIRALREKYNVPLKELRIKRQELKDKGLETTKEFYDVRLEIGNLVKEKKKKTKEIENQYFDFKKGKLIGPKSKYRTDLSSLSETEKELLKLFRSVTDKGHEITFGKNSLKEYTFKTQFYELPKITKSSLERIYEGDIKGIFIDKIDDLTKTRADDIEFVNKNINLNNKEVRKLRLAYRTYPGVEFDSSDQSLDLMTMYRLEFKNTNRFNVRRKAETELNFLVDIAEDSEYYRKEGSRVVTRAKDGKAAASKNPNSPAVQMMKNMLETRLYDIGQANNVTWGSVDMNKAVKFLNSSSAFLTLSLNLASGTANVINANAQMFLETVFKGYFFTAKDIAKAEKVYMEHLLSTLQDNVNPINEGYVNQVMELFHVRGMYNLSNSNFLQSTLLKSGLDLNSLQVFQNSGEHWIQSIVSMAVLNNIKVKNGENKYIDKDGNVVNSKDKAASLLDMTKMNEETELVEVDPRVVYTSHSRAVKWNEGGKTKVDMLVRKKIYDTIGDYTQIDQPEIMRHWWGKLIMLYRKYLVPMGQARLRGIETSFTKKENLREDQKRFSYALQEYEEGAYTTTVRYITTMLKDGQKRLFGMNNWNKLSDYEKHNIKRATVELFTTMVILPLATMLVAGAAADWDDDRLFFIAYELRRAKTELSSYRDISEFFKMMRSPIPSARLLETGFQLVGGVFSPWSWDETYQTGANKGRNKLLVKTYKQIPVVKEFQRKYQDLFEYQNATFGIR